MGRGQSLVRLVHQPDLGLLLVRLMVGVVGMFHGSQKLFGLFGGRGVQGFADSLETLGIPLPLASAVEVA